jgi:N-acyl-phosphatidylethanolamine-hydrolysing phospholipase D
MRIFSFAATLLVLSTTSTIVGCVSHNPYYDPAKPHHTPEGFRNNYPPNPAYRRPETGFFKRWSKRLGKWMASSEAYAPRHVLKTVAPDHDFIHANKVGFPFLTWIGHATFLLQNGSGLAILTDPVFDERASPLPFAGPKRH